jgi:hypothetical protein
MQRDYLDNPLSTQHELTLRAIDNFIGGFLAYDVRAEQILAAANADPESCLANAYAGMLWMLLESPSAASNAMKYLIAAESIAPRSDRREQLNVAMLRAWVDDDLAQTIRLCDQVTDEFPRDLAMVKLHQYFEFNRGNAAQMLRAVLKVADANAHVSYIHGMSAFAYEQCHLLDDAESAAQTALAMQHKEPWAQHALAHVMLTRGRIDEGVRFMEGVTDTWTGLNSFMLTHLWWHLALFYLSQGRDLEALGLYDRHCWGVAKDYSQDQVGAVSLLARLEIAGIDVKNRWDDLADHLEMRAADTVQPFLTLQYLYGLARADRPHAEVLLEAVRSFASNAPEFVRSVWREVALPACDGLLAYARRDYERAWKGLAQAVPRMAEVGGSHAQRDLFEQLLLDAARRSGRLSIAQQLLEIRRNCDPHGVPVNNALAAVYSDLGLTVLAELARSRAQHTRSRHAR